MKRLLLAVAITCFTLSLAAQNGIKVNYQGEKPTISDFVGAYLSETDEDEEEGYADESFNAVKYAWNQHLQGVPQDENVTLTIDEKNGIVIYENRQDENLLRIEMCYWNETDKKHKLFAYNVSCFTNDQYSPGQFDGLTFYRYDNAKKEMVWCDDTGFDVEYGTEDGAWVSYALPRSGKDITVTYWYNDKGKKQKTLKWDGRRFSL